MTIAALPITEDVAKPQAADSGNIWRQVIRSGRVLWGGGILLSIIVACLVTLPWTLGVEKSGTPVYSYNYPGVVREPPRIWPVRSWFGYDDLGRLLFESGLVGVRICLAGRGAAGR